jgi:Electron transfer DM13
MLKHNLMRKFFISILIPALMCACNKEENTPMDSIDDPAVPSGTVLAQGQFAGTLRYQVSGSVKYLQSNRMKTVRLENFSSANGPDLKVYLAKDLNATAFINLGVLRSVSGNQNYNVTGMPDISQYQYVLIWCEQFGALFGSAQLK